MPLRLPRLAKAVAVAVAGLAVAPVVVIGLPGRANSAPIRSAPTPSVLSREHWLRTSHILSAWRTSQGAVLADGVAASQPDLSGSVIVGQDFTNSGRRPDSRYYGVTGTGLASLIVGNGHPSRAGHQGVFGVATAAKVLSVRVTLSPDDPLWTAPPGANFAMKGALPRIDPATPPVPSLGSSIRADLIRDGVIAFVALVVLLVPIIWYGSVARRRDRLALAAEHQWRERARPEHPTTLADPLLQYFAPQPTRPADPVPQSRPAASPRFQPTSSLTGRPPLAQSGRAARIDSLLPAPTASAATSSPPWEPAPEPTIALPWSLRTTPDPASAMPQAPHSGTTGQPQRWPGGATPQNPPQPPSAARNAPPARASLPPRSLFEPGPVVHPSAPTTQERSAPDDEASAQDSGSRPIYVWKPGSTGPLGGSHDDKTGWQSLGSDPD